MNDTSLGSELAALARVSADRVSAVAGFDAHARVLRDAAVMFEAAADRWDVLVFAIDIADLRCRAEGVDGGRLLDVLHARMARDPRRRA